MWRWPLTFEMFQSLVQVVGLPLAVTGVVLWTGARGIWRWGNAYDELREDRDYWRELALKGTDLAETAVRSRSRRARP